MIKDAYKAKFFDPGILERKRREVLENPDGGMDEGMVTPEEYELLLLDNFSHAARFWDAGNFKGYVAGHDGESVDLFLNLVPSLVSGYSTVETPFFLTA